MVGFSLGSLHFLFFMWLSWQVHVNEVIHKVKWLLPSDRRAEWKRNTITESMFCREIIPCTIPGCLWRSSTITEQLRMSTVHRGPWGKTWFRSPFSVTALRMPHTEMLGSQIIYTEIFSDFIFMQNVQGSWGCFEMWTNDWLDASLSSNCSHSIWRYSFILVITEHKSWI